MRFRLSTVFSLLILITGLYAENEELAELEKYFENPLRINYVSKDELKEFPLFDNKTIAQLLKIRKNRSIRESDLSEINSPEIIIGEIIDFSKKNNFQHKEYLRIKNYSFSDNKLQIDHFFNYKFNNWNASFINQKDKDEESYFDHVAYSIHFKNEQKLFSDLVIGNFKIKNSHHILLGNSGTMTKSENTTKVNNPRIKILPYRSFSESGNFNGVASKINYSIVSLSFLYSNTNQDIKIKDGEIYSFNFSGDHSKDFYKGKEEVIGSNLAIEFKNIFISYLFINQQISSSFSQNFSQDFNDFSYKINLNNLSFYGEELIHNKNLHSRVLGLKFNEGNFKHVCSYRNFSADLLSFRGNPLSEYSRFSGESGLYNGVSYRINKRLKLNIYYDYFWDNNLNDDKFFNKGNETLISGVYSKDKMLFKVNFKKEEKKVLQENESSLINVSEVKNKTSLFVLLPFKQQQILKFKWIIILNSDTNSINFKNGTLFYLQHDIKSDNWLLINRLSISNSEIPIYSYENNIYGIFQNKIFTNDQLTWFSLIKAKYKDFSFQIKFETDIKHTQKNSFSVLIGKI